MFPWAVVAFFRRVKTRLGIEAYKKFIFIRFVEVFGGHKPALALNPLKRIILMLLPNFDTIYGEYDFFAPCSSPYIWNNLFKKDKNGHYKTAGHVRIRLDNGVNVAWLRRFLMVPSIYINEVNGQIRPRIMGFDVTNPIAGFRKDFPSQIHLLQTKIWNRAFEKEPQP